MRIRESVAVSHRGSRGHNEDAVLKLPQIPLFAVADGMGGPGAGDLAAGLALEHIRQAAPTLSEMTARVAADRSAKERLAFGRRLDELVNRASREVQRESTRLQRPGMGSTIVLAAIIRNYAYIAHVGDSRAYLWREGRLSRLTEDHTLAELHFRRGKLSKEEYLRSPERRVLYQALGAGVELDGDLAEVRLAGGDVLLLCSDGLPRALDEARIARCIEPDDLEGSQQTILEAALKAGAPDNLSLVLLAMEADPGDEPLSAVTEAMRDVFLFRDMTPPELLSLAPYLEDLVAAAGETIASDGEAGPGFAVVVSGVVRLSRGRTVLEEVRSGEYFGETTLTRQPGRSPSIRALSDARLLVLNRERFQDLVRQKPELGNRLSAALLDALSERLRDLSERMVAVERAVRGELK